MYHSIGRIQPTASSFSLRPAGVALLILLVSAPSANAIPAFARKYRVSCQLCHNPVPALTEFGDTFAGNGFRFTSEEQPRDTIDTGDGLLDLMKDLPLAMRIDLFSNVYANGTTRYDIELPWNVKILTGGALSRKISYYLYFFLFERGEIGGIEDAYIYINDIAGAPVDIMFGQFQVSDPMFKRELRLEFADYVIYRVRIGDQLADLTYDRGVSGIWSPSTWTISGTVVNGNGRGAAEPDRQLDNDAHKNFFTHITTPIIPELRLGAMGYWGRMDGETAGGQVITNDLWMLGADGTIASGLFELNFQYVHRQDNNPTYTIGEPTAKTNGGFIEGIYRFRGNRWYTLALYNLIHCSEPLLNPRLGLPRDLTRFQLLSFGAGYMFRRNFRGFAEIGWDFEADVTRWTMGISTAF